MTLTPVQIQYAHGLCAEATEKPWTLQIDPDDVTWKVIGDGDTVATVLMHRDAAFIAASRTLLPEALEMIEGLQGQLVADEQRLREAGERCGINFGCDTPEVMADEIKGLQQRITELEQKLSTQFLSFSHDCKFLDSDECGHEGGTYCYSEYCPRGNAIRAALEPAAAVGEGVGK